MNAAARPGTVGLGVLCWSIVPALCAAAEIVSVDLPLSTPSAAVNTLTLTLSVTALGQTKSDTEKPTLSGNALANLTVRFNHSTRAATTTGLEFTGGDCRLSDVAFSISYGLLGMLYANGTGIAGTLDTPLPPGSVSGTTFPGGEHVVILNRGTISAFGTGVIGTLFPPTTVDLSAEPMTAGSDQMGSLVVSPPTILGQTARYDVTMSMPIALDEVVYDNGTVAVRAAGSGLLKAAGQFTRPIPRLGDLDGSGLVNAADIDLLYDHVPSTDPEYDVNGDSAVNQQDVDVLVCTVLGSQYGDTDLDGDVDFYDFLTTKSSFGMVGVAGWADGDSDGDRDVDFLDYLTTKGNFGWPGLGLAPAGGPAATPEPAGMALFLAASLALLRGKAVRRSRP